MASISLQAVTRRAQRRSAVASREYELRVGELDAIRAGRMRVALAQFRGGLGVSLLDGAEEVLRLVLELIQVRTDGQVTVGHDEPPWMCPSPPTRAKGGSWKPIAVQSRSTTQVDSVLSADGRRPARLWA